MPSTSDVAHSRGAVVWFTGLSGAGKSTLADAIAERLASAVPLERLDGDEFRKMLSTGLSFTRADRDINVRRIAYVARLLAKHGVLVIVAAIAPHADTRSAVRRLSEEAGHSFLEIFVNAPLATLIERDPKGLYKRALAGEIASFTGISDPYEPPLSPALELRTDLEAPETSVQRILDLLRAHQLVP